MDQLSPYLLTAAIAWVVAQGLKYVIRSIRTRSLKNVRQLYLSGSMPSAHSATTVALLYTVGAYDGVNSAVFGIAALFAAVVMYDALMVRRSSGEQGEAIKGLITETKSKVKVPRVAKGHTPLEVLAGAVLGLIVGAVVFLASS